MTQRFPGPLFSVLVALLGITPLPVLAQDRAHDLLDEAAERYWSIETLCARFDQVIEITLLRESHASRGTICQRQPDRFSMRFTDPEGDVVVVDGEFLWAFYPSMDARQVLRFRADGAEGRFNFYKRFLDKPRERFEATYEGREELPGGLSHRISVTPRQPTDFRSAVIWIHVESRLITGVDVFDANESIRHVRLTEIRVDPDVSDDEFRFTPPAGVTVISR